MSNKSESFSNQLLAADSEPSKDRFEQERMLRELIEKETRFEQKLEKLLKFTWSITVVCIVVLAACFTIIHTEQGSVVEYARMFSLIAGASGIIGLTVATLSTFAWLSRSRAVPLAVIEKRLASMERSLTSLESGRQENSIRGPNALGN